MSTGTRLSGANLVLIGICALIYLLDGLIHSILGPLAPDMARSLSLGNSDLGPIFSANLLGQCIGLVVFPLFGRIGQRAIVLISLVGFGLGQTASALADGAAELIAWRLVTGLFLGGCLPSCLAPGEQPKYAPISSGDHLTSKFVKQTTFGGTKAVA